MGWVPPTRFYRTKNRLLRAAGIDVHPSARIVSSVSFIGTGPVTIGSDTFIGHRTVIIAAGAPVHIGSNVDIAPCVYVGNGSHHIDMTGSHSAGPGYSAPISVEDGVWIGAGALILPGVKIGKKAIIGAGSVVIRDVPPFCVAAGVPCRVLKVWSPEVGQWKVGPE